MESIVIHVYVIIANEEERVRKCVVVTGIDNALLMFDHFKETYGGANVCMASRCVDDTSELHARTTEFREIECER